MTDLEIAGESIGPGERRLIEVPLAPTFTHDDLTLSVKVIRGRKPGPTLFVSAAVHGDEICGVEIIRRLLRHSALKSLRGSLVTIPIVNVYGFQNHSRYLPDGRDLNRSFPGSAKGSLTGRVAHTFFNEIVAKCSHGIDLHTGARHRSNYPQVRADLDDPVAHAMTLAFGVPLAIDAKIRDGSLRECAGDAGIPVILYEAGEALRFEEIHIRAGVTGVIRVMREIGMLPPAKTTIRKRDPIICNQTSWVRSPASGVLRTRVGLGDRVEKGQILAYVADPLGDTDSPIEAPNDGVVIGATRLPLMYEGDATFHIARYGKRAEQVERDVERFQEELSSAPKPLA